MHYVKNSMTKNRMVPTWILYNINKKDKSLAVSITSLPIPIEVVDIWDSLG